MTDGSLLALHSLDDNTLRCHSGSFKRLDYKCCPFKYTCERQTTIS